MIGRLLIDECLSPELAQLAIDAGHVESTSVRDRGRLGLKDWELMEYVIQEDFILVTRNAQDFRGAGKANPGGLHAEAEVHAGLICLDSALEVDLDLQQELFRHALNMPPCQGSALTSRVQSCEPPCRLKRMCKGDCLVRRSERLVAHERAVLIGPEPITC